MDGLETTIAIREKEKVTKQHMPIVGLTANTYDADREKCLSYGIEEYMAKPFDLQEFFNNLKKLNII
jgi:CheY-like chemotaxis protein